MSHELYHRYRPKKLTDVVGQDSALKVLNGYIKSKQIPHAILFVGPSGCGKTTLARILKNQLVCHDMDFEEVNCAAIESPIEAIRNIQQRMGLAPVAGPVRVWLLDEVQALSRAGFAQQALLKMLEDVPKHCYFFLATTDPGKVIPTIRNRCTEIALKSISTRDLGGLISAIITKEKIKVSEEVMDRVIETADGSARKALVLLESVIRIEGEEEQLEAVHASDSRRQAIDLCRALMNPTVTWPEVAKILREVQEEAETIRHIMLGYMSSVMLKGGKGLDRAHQIILGFEMDFFSSRKAGLIAACYQIVRNR